MGDLEDEPSGSSKSLNTASQEVKINGNRSSSSVSPESSISTSRGSTPNLINVNLERNKVLDWWKRVSLDYASSSVLNQENWIQAFHDTDMEEIKEDLLEEFNQILYEELKTLTRDEAKRHIDRLRSQLQIFEDNRIYEIRKKMLRSDKNMRYEYFGGQFMDDMKKKFKDALKEKEHEIFAEEWRKDVDDYSKGVVIDMDNNLRNEMGRTLQKTTRMFRNTATELSVNKQANIQIAENNIQSYAMTLTSNCEERKGYLRNTITEHLSEERQRHDQALKETMEKELRTLRRELEQLQKTMGYGSARRCCDSLCSIL